MKINNIFTKIPIELPDEIIEPLIETQHCVIERIVSKGHTSPNNFWYDQAKNEWVIVLKGQARLRFAEDDQVVEMRTGDYVNIPTHCKHRVEWTDPNGETIWLAVHY